MKILTVLGARPQFIKASVVSKAIADRPGLREVVVHTGQHHDENMSAVFFDELGMREPQYPLSINGGGHGEMTGRMLIEVEKVLVAERPDVVLVYGDTNSTLAGALAAVKLHIPIAHVEAGLRSFNMRMPEEVNRILTDRISRWLFAPTDEAVAHLQREGMDSDRIHCVGDVMYDVAIQHGQRADHIFAELCERFALDASGYVLVTVHRAENTDAPERLRTIVEALTRVADHMQVVWPLHPRTRAALQREGLLDSLGAKITLIDPQGYLAMVALERRATVIATDSGGVQKEAFFHKVPCVTLRDETEWIELVNSGWNRLAPPIDGRALADTIEGMRGHLGIEVEPYGKGDAAGKIADVLARGTYGA